MLIFVLTGDSIVLKFEPVAEVYNLCWNRVGRLQTVATSSGEGRRSLAGGAGACLYSAPESSGKAHVAELVDALDSGSSGGDPVEVRVFS